MSTLTYAVADSATMLRRDFKHTLRYPSMTLQLVGMPIVILLLFVYVFGGTLGAGLGHAAAGRAEYLAYVVPGILLMAVATKATGTAIFRSALLVGHVLGSVTQCLLSLAVVTGVAVLIGFRPSASPVEWVAAIGVLALISLALTWLAVAFGMVAKTVESASNLPMPLVFLPFLGSGFVPTGSMPTGLRWFAEYQPFTPLIETVRGLLLGTPIGNHAVIGIAWGVGITVLGYLWARRLYDRDPVR